MKKILSVLCFVLVSCTVVTRDGTPITQEVIDDFGGAMWTLGCLEGIIKVKKRFNLGPLKEEANFCNTNGLKKAIEIRTKK